MLAHVPGAYALIAQTTRSARIRRSKLGFGMLSHRPLPDELTAAWMEPMCDPALRADLVATLKAIDKQTRDVVNAAAEFGGGGNAAVARGKDSGRAVERVAFQARVVSQNVIGNELRSRHGLQRRIGQEGVARLRDLVETLLFGEQPGARRQHYSPELRLAFIDPQQAVAHRHVEVRRPQVSRTTELAIPRMRVLVSQQVAIGRKPAGCAIIST